MYRTSEARVCPRCGSPLTAHRQADVCATCGGVMVAADVLAEAAHPDAPPRITLWWRRARLRCPACGGVMLPVRAGELALDRCAEHGLWLDPGEIDRLLDPPDPSAPPRDALAVGDVIDRLRARLARD